MTVPLTPGAVERIDEACDRFEAAWKAGGRPSIEDFLGELTGQEHRASLRELLALDLAYRRHGGESPTHDEYRIRFPAHFDLIDAAFDEASRMTAPGRTEAPRIVPEVGCPGQVVPLGSPR